MIDWIVGAGVLILLGVIFWMGKLYTDRKKK